MGIEEFIKNKAMAESNTSSSSSKILTHSQEKLDLKSSTAKTKNSRLAFYKIRPNQEKSKNLNADDGSLLRVFPVKNYIKHKFDEFDWNVLLDEISKFEFDENRRTEVEETVDNNHSSPKRHEKS